MFVLKSKCIKVINKWHLDTFLFCVILIKKIKLHFIHRFNIDYPLLYQ